MKKISADRLRHLALLAEKYPTADAASAEIIHLEALLRLPKGTEHFMSDLHGEHEAFIHILNNASGVIREKIERLFDNVCTPREMADLATLIYYPAQKLPELKAEQTDLEAWYRTTLFRLIDLCKLVSSKYTRRHVRHRLPADCARIVDELLHANFEDHDKILYYDQIVSTMIRLKEADHYIISLCRVIKLLAVDRLHIVGDLFDRGPRPDRIMDELLHYENVDFQWGNHDVVWMGAAAGSPICVMTVLKSTLAYNNVDLLERGYGISLRSLEHFAEMYYADTDLKRWMPHADSATTDARPETLRRVALMHKAAAILMFKLELAVSDRNPDFGLDTRTSLRSVNYRAGTVNCNGETYPLLDRDFPTVDPSSPETLLQAETEVLHQLCRAFRESEKLQRHVRFLFDKGSVYLRVNGNLLYHGAVLMDEDGAFKKIAYRDETYEGRAWMDCCDTVARQGYYAPEGSPERQLGQDLLWYLWCGAKSPIYGRSAMTTFERIYIADHATHKEVKDPYYRHIAERATADRILEAFDLRGENCHIVNGHVPVRAVEGENPVKAGGRLIVIDGGFCTAYHEKTGIAGYTLVFNSHGLVLRTHQPFETAEKAIHEDTDINSRSERIYTAPRRILVSDTDTGAEKRTQISDLEALVEAYRLGLIHENAASD